MALQEEMQILASDIEQMLSRDMGHPQVDLKATHEALGDRLNHTYMLNIQKLESSAGGILAVKIER